MMNQSFPVFFQLPMLIELQMNFPASAEECSLKKKKSKRKKKGLVLCPAFIPLMCRTIMFPLGVVIVLVFVAMRNCTNIMSQIKG